MGECVRESGYSDIVTIATLLNLTFLGFCLHLGTVYNSSEKHHILREITRLAWGNVFERVVIVTWEATKRGAQPESNKFMHFEIYRPIQEGTVNIIHAIQKMHQKYSFFSLQLIDSGVQMVHKYSKTLFF